MVAAIRNADFRQIAASALAIDRHDLAQKKLLIAPSFGDRDASQASDARPAPAPHSVPRWRKS